MVGLSNGVGAALKSEAIGDPERRPSAEAAHPPPQPTYPSNVPDPVGSITSHGAPGTEYFFFKPSIHPLSGCPSGASRATFLVTVETSSANQLQGRHNAKDLEFLRIKYRLLLADNRINFMTDNPWRI